MKIARTVEEVRHAVGTARVHGATIGFVPTMGYLHDGHLSLVEMARGEDAAFIVVSIFVNPTQFGPNEDFDSYPRDQTGDITKLESYGVDLVFLPTVETLYPEGASTRVIVHGVSEPLEGARRPGHFEGVATVVAKLFNIVRPDLAVFGQKDAQQCAVIKRMVHDLDIPVRLVFGATLREPDGLALSSRNVRLDPESRRIAPALYAALCEGERVLRKETTSVLEVETAMREVLSQSDAIEIDYITLVDPATFRTPERLTGSLLLAGAIRIGKVRLIDNVLTSRPG